MGDWRARPAATAKAPVRTPEQLIQFEDPGALLALAGLPEISDDETLASLFGIGADRYRAVCRSFADGVAEAARRMLDDPWFMRQLEGLRIGAEDTIVAAGDSLTADRQSWAEILAHLIAPLSGGSGPRLINAGISGDATTNVVARIEPLLEAQPEWLVVLIGTNDARRHGSPESPMLVSDRETEANLDKLAEIVAGRTDAKLVWITPPPILPTKLDADPALRADGVHWRADDVASKARLAAERPGLKVDLHRLMVRGDLDDLLQADGLHLSLRGQMLVVRALVAALAGSEA